MTLVIDVTGGAVSESPAGGRDVGGGSGTVRPWLPGGVRH